jgi:hypothetical protein
MTPCTTLLIKRCMEVILEEEDKYSIYITKDNQIMPWKDFNKNMAISVEYNLEY